MCPILSLTTVTHHILPLWSELVGIVQDYCNDEYCIHVIIDNKALTFSKDSSEAQILDRTMTQLLGKKVGILRTDLPGKKLCIRHFEQ
jgi:hypothetical protein